ncbi:MAG: tetratricopeptide repeat protein [Acidobacteria bacterium]|nr:tetratricopeptide repeat protein [Acidobacteriota bacterium]
MPPLCALITSLCLPEFAIAERKSYTMEGRLQPTWFSMVFVRVSGVGTGYNARQEVYWDGKFKFKNLPQGAYSVSVVVPRMGEFRQTYSVGPSTSDNRGRVKVTMVLNPSKAIRTFTAKERFTVPASRLSITEKAWKEYMDAQKSLNKEDRAGAEAHLEKAIEISPQFSAAWNTLGVLAYQDRKMDLAEERFRQAERLDPLLFEPIVNLGGVLLHNGKYDEALTYNTRAVERRPKDPLAHVQLGLTYLQMKRIDAAVRHLEQAKQIDPGHYAFPQLILSDIYLKQGNRIAAASELESFLRYHPDYEMADSLRSAIRKLRGIHEPPRPSSGK